MGLNFAVLAAEEMNGETALQSSVPSCEHSINVCGQKQELISSVDEDISAVLFSH